MKVHVVGGGPTGAVAALEAAKRGAQVILSEEHGEAGVPQNCSGLFSREGLSYLGFHFKEAVLNRIDGARIFLGDLCLEVEKKGVAFVHDRALFDQLLLQEAENEGVKVRYNDKVTNNFYADNVIGADGPHSAVARFFSMGRIGKFAYTLQSYVKRRNDSKVEVYLSPRFHGFFGWVIPHSEEVAEVGVGAVKDVAGAWRYFSSLLGISARPKGWVIPLRFREKTSLIARNKKVLLVGDAAGQVKASTGGGVILGCACAKLAGRFFDNPFLYEVAWRSKWGADFYLHHLIQSTLEHSALLNSLFKYFNKHYIEEYLEKWGNMDRPTKMLSPWLPLYLLGGLKWKERLKDIFMRSWQ